MIKPLFLISYCYNFFNQVLFRKFSLVTIDSTNKFFASIRAADSWQSKYSKKAISSDFDRNSIF